MNDFLQSIRNGNYSKENGSNSKPRYSNNNNGQRPRRPYEQNQSGNYMRNGNERKFRPRTGTEGYLADETTPSPSTMTTIKETLTAILTAQETSLTFAERRAIAEERKADAFEFIATHIGKLTGETFAPQMKPVVTPKKDVETPVVVELQEETVSEILAVDSNSDMNKDDILEMIAKMRRDGSTYNEIASHLSDLNLPTFSGRGKWHAQTIHRLCQAV